MTLQLVELGKLGGGGVPVAAFTLGGSQPQRLDSGINNLQPINPLVHTPDSPHIWDQVGNNVIVPPGEYIFMAVMTVSSSGSTWNVQLSTDTTGDYLASDSGGDKIGATIRLAAPEETQISIQAAGSPSSASNRDISPGSPATTFILIGPLPD